MYPKSENIFTQLKLQNIDRDFAFIFDENINSDKILNTILQSNTSIKSVDIFDIYRDSNIGENKKSIAFTVQIKQGNTQMTDKDLENISNDIEKSVASIGGILRKM